MDFRDFWVKVLARRQDRHIYIEGQSKEQRQSVMGHCGEMFELPEILSHTSTPIPTHSSRLLVSCLVWSHRKSPQQSNEPSSLPFDNLELLLRLPLLSQVSHGPKVSSPFPIKTSSKKKNRGTHSH